MTPQLPLLAIDAASPVVSVAVGDGGEFEVCRTLELRRSSERLLVTIEEVLAEAGVTLRDLGGLIALQGPGSFTGLRIGLATVLGFHQALGVPATALPTLPILAATAAVEPPAEVVAAVDALRGDWYAQRFRITAWDVAPLDEARLLSTTELRALGVGRIVGFGVERLAAEPGWGEVELVEPPALAPVAVRRAAAAPPVWDAARLTAPIYFRPPAVTLPDG